MKSADKYLSVDTWESLVKESIPYVKEYVNTVLDSVVGDDLDSWDEEFGALLFESGFSEDLDISISQFNSQTIPEELRSVPDLNKVIEKSVIFAIKEHFIRQVKEKELDINDIMIDNAVERGVLLDVEAYLEEIKETMLEGYKENIDE